MKVVIYKVEKQIQKVKAKIKKTILLYVVVGAKKAAAENLPPLLLKRYTVVQYQKMMYSPAPFCRSGIISSSTSLLTR